MAIYSLILQLQTRGTISVTWKKTALPVLVCLGLLTLFCSCNSYPDDSLYQAILETDNNASPWSNTIIRPASQGPYPKCPKPPR